MPNQPETVVPRTQGSHSAATRPKQRRTVDRFSKKNSAKERARLRSKRSPKQARQPADLDIPLRPAVGASRFGKRRRYGNRRKRAPTLDSLSQRRRRAKFGHARTRADKRALCSAGGKKTCNPAVPFSTFGKKKRTTNEHAGLVCTYIEAISGQNFCRRRVAAWRGVATSERVSRLRTCTCTSVLNYAACIFSGLFGGSQSLAGNPASLRAHRVTRLQEARKTRENFSISQQAAPARDLARRDRTRDRERAEGAGGDGGGRARRRWDTGRRGREKSPSSGQGLETGNRITLEFLAGRFPRGHATGSRGARKFAEDNFENLGEPSSAANAPRGTCLRVADERSILFSLGAPGD